MSKSKIPQEMFQHLVNNALKFLGQSIADMEKKPKYSVIHFHAAIELVLKARLMDEHCSLVRPKGSESNEIHDHKGQGQLKFIWTLVIKSY